MLLMERRIWSGQAVSADTTFESVEPQLAHFLSYILTLQGSGFSGSIAIQGREANDDTWSNLSYREIDAGGRVGPLTTETLSLTASSGRTRYLIPISPAFVRLSLTLSAGTVSAWVRGSGAPISLPVDGGLADYYRLSTEPRPGNPYSDADTVIGVGAILLEYDTGLRFVYAGSQRGWVGVAAPSGVEALLEQILQELAWIRKGQELVLLDENISQEG